MAIEVNITALSVDEADQDEISLEVRQDGREVFSHTVVAFDPFNTMLSVEVARRNTVVAYLEMLWALPARERPTSG